jgi:hypothetical protein
MIMKIKILATCTFSISILTFNKIRGFPLRYCGGVSWPNEVPHIEYVLSFLKNEKVKQPVIFFNITENQNLGKCIYLISILIFIKIRGSSFKNCGRR